MLRLSLIRTFPGLLAVCMGNAWTPISVDAQIRQDFLWRGATVNCPVLRHSRTLNANADALTLGASERGVSCTLTIDWTLRTNQQNTAYGNALMSVVGQSGRGGAYDGQRLMGAVRKVGDWGVQYSLATQSLPGSIGLAILYSDDKTWVLSSPAFRQITVAQGNNRGPTVAPPKPRRAPTGTRDYRIRGREVGELVDYARAHAYLSRLEPLGIPRPPGCSPAVHRAEGVYLPGWGVKLGTQGSALAIPTVLVQHCVYHFMQGRKLANGWKLRLVRIEGESLFWTWRSPPHPGTTNIYFAIEVENTTAPITKAAIHNLVGELPRIVEIVLEGPAGRDWREAFDFPH